MVFDITLCGDWAGVTYNAAGYSGSCADRVTDPANFKSEFFSRAIHRGGLRFLPQRQIGTLVPSRYTIDILQ